jgi:FtsH-binding integral membrane protein
MAEGFKPRPAPFAVAGARADIDEGLRTYMLRVYNYMASALLLTGIVALGVAQSPALLQAIFGTPLQWVVMLAPLGLVMFLGFRINQMSVTAAQATFWAYSALLGVSLASIFMVYTGASVARIFFITSAAFGGLSLYGYTTKRSLSGFGSFLVMGLIGLVIASVVNMFLKSSAMMFIISAVGVLIFAGLTAYDTQQIKEMYYESDGRDVAAKKSIMGALRLYLDFLNMFLMLLQLFGDRR